MKTLKNGKRTFEVSNITNQDGYLRVNDKGEKNYFYLPKHVIDNFK